MLCLVILVLFIATFGNCNACYLDDDSLVTAGEYTKVCLILSPLNWGGSTYNESSRNFLSVQATLKADAFSAINVTNAWTSQNYTEDATMRRLMIQNTTVGLGLGISLGSAGVPSYQKAYRRVEFRGIDASTAEPRISTVTFRSMMAVIHVKKGKVTEITWDDTCSWCDTNRCSANTYNYAGEVMNTGAKSCLILDSECIIPDTQKIENGVVVSKGDIDEECKLRVYVTWTGTDAKGFPFLSAANRFSRLTTTQMQRIMFGGDAAIS
jgi:hypothetical protein